MPDKTMRQRTTYHSRSCGLHLCYHIAQGFYLTDPRSYIEEAGEPKFRCEHCGRRASRRGRLCQAQALKEESR